MERILFIVPPNLTYEAFMRPPANVKATRKKGDRQFGVVITDMPLGVLSLSAYARKFAGTRSKIVDFNIVLNQQQSFNHGSFSEFFRVFLARPEFSKFQPSVVCISALFAPSYQSLIDLADRCREQFPAAIIVAGGGLPTNIYREIFAASASFDALCYGEGEKPLLALLRAGNKQKLLEDHPSWITVKKIQEKKNFQHDFIEDLDDIPFLDYDLLDLPAYRLSPTIAAYTSIKKNKISLPLMTSRGCPHHCSFCASHTVHGRQVRYYSLERVKKDLTRLKRRYGAEIIIFQDDHFLVNKERFFKIISFLRSLRLTAFFPNALALYALDKSVLAALKSVGVRQLVLAVESGSERVLRDIMHKPLNLSIVKRVADDCRQLGIYTDANILIGLPGEKKKDINDAGVFLRTLNANWFRINVATPLAGSEMLAVCLKKGYVKGDYLACDFKKAVVGTEDFTREYIQKKAYELNLELNFVANSDLRLGDYRTALKGFKNALKAKNDHAFALYCVALCYNKLGLAQRAKEFRRRAKWIASKDNFWRYYAKKFNFLK